LEVSALFVLGLIFYWYGKRKIIRTFMNEGHNLREAIKDELTHEESKIFFEKPEQFSTKKYSPDQQELLEKYQHWDQERIKANL